MYRQSEKSLLSSNISPRCPQNIVNFDPLAAEIVSLVWGTPVISTGFASWQRYCTALYRCSGRQPNAALNRGRHLYSAGRPSRWALAHISSFCISSEVGPIVEIQHLHMSQRVKRPWYGLLKSAVSEVWWKSPTKMCLNKALHPSKTQSSLISAQWM